MYVDQYGRPIGNDPEPEPNFILESIFKNSLASQRRNVTSSELGFYHQSTMVDSAAVAVATAPYTAYSPAIEGTGAVTATGAMVSQTARAATLGVKAFGQDAAKYGVISAVGLRPVGTAILATEGVAVGGSILAGADAGVGAPVTQGARTVASVAEDIPVMLQSVRNTQRQTAKVVVEATDVADVKVVNHIGSAWDAPTTTRWNPSAKSENCIACVASYTTDRLDGKAGSFMTADDVERIYASVDPSRGLQLSEAIDIIRKAAKSEVAPVIKTPFAKDAVAGQYALFLGPSKEKLRHVIHAEVLPNNGGVKMFDPQNGEDVLIDDLLSLRIKWGGSKDSPIVPVLIRGQDDE